MKIDVETPYFVHRDGLPGIDFNREIIEPGENETFPKGAVGIRVDDDFWPVAALPLAYRDTPLEEIVRELWPQYADEAEITPDHGSQERLVWYYQRQAESTQRLNDHLDKELRETRDEMKRLRMERPPTQPRIEDRVQAEKSYFIRQYEHLLVAMAHKADPREDKPGICGKCGLYGSDRVHMQHYIDLHDAGYAPAIKHLLEYND